MAMNQDWPRWIFASISNHFNTNKPADVEFFIEGQVRKNMSAESVIELRIDGPYGTELSKDYWELYSEVSLLISCSKTDGDYHRIQRLCGKIAATFTTIPVFKFGDGPNDAPTTQIGCLDLIQDLGKRERIQINHYGQIKTDTGIVQASVEGHYRIQLTA